MGSSKSTPGGLLRTTKSHYIILSILYTEGVTNTSEKGPRMKDLTCNDSVKSQQGDNFLNKFVQKAQK